MAACWFRLSGLLRACAPFALCLQACCGRRQRALRATHVLGLTWRSEAWGNIVTSSIHYFCCVHRGFGNFRGVLRAASCEGHSESVLCPDGLRLHCNRHRLEGGRGHRGRKAVVYVPRKTGLCCCTTTRLGLGSSFWKRGPGVWGVGHIPANHACHASSS